MGARRWDGQETKKPVITKTGLDTLRYICSDLLGPGPLPSAEPHNFVKRSVLTPKFAVKDRVHIAHSRLAVSAVIEDSSATRQPPDVDEARPLGRRRELFAKKPCPLALIQRTEALERQNVDLRPEQTTTILNYECLCQGSGQLDAELSFPTSDVRPRNDSGILVPELLQCIRLPILLCSYGTSAGAQQPRVTGKWIGPQQRTASRAGCVERFRRRHDAAVLAADRAKVQRSFGST